MAREYRIPIGSLPGKFEDIRRGMKGGVTDWDHFAVDVAIAERLEALVEGVDHLVRILDTRIGSIGQY